MAARETTRAARPKSACPKVNTKTVLSSNFATLVRIVRAPPQCHRLLESICFGVDHIQAQEIS